jgi:hypothetical protein
MSGVNPIVRRRLCRLPSCPVMFDTPHGGSWPAAFHSAACHRASKTPPPAKPRAAIVTTPTKKRRRSFTPASAAQRAALDGARSVVSGATEGLQPAHLAARARGGCDDPLCSVPLTAPEHRLFDDGQLDLLPHLIRAGRTAEIAHALIHYDGHLVSLLTRLTGKRWAPVRGDA